MSELPSRPAPTPVLTIDDFVRQYRLGRTKVYAELKTGALRAVKIGRRTMIRRADAEAWLASLNAYAPRSAA